MRRCQSRNINWSLKKLIQPQLTERFQDFSGKSYCSGRNSERAKQLEVKSGNMTELPSCLMKNFGRYRVAS